LQTYLQFDLHSAVRQFLDDSSAICAGSRVIDVFCIKNAVCVMLVSGFREASQVEPIAATVDRQPSFILQLAGPAIALNNRFAMGMQQHFLPGIPLLVGGLVDPTVFAQLDDNRV
jgi:hypothetical protein